jgi:hypothetical protein
LEDPNGLKKAPERLLSSRTLKKNSTPGEKQRVATCLKIKSAQTTLKELGYPDRLLEPFAELL